MSKYLLLLAIFSLMIFSSCSDNEVGDDLLDWEQTTTTAVNDNSLNIGVAAFTIDNQNIKVLEKDDLLLTDNSVNAVSYHWDFGNGDTSTEANPSYSYDLHGIFTITLVITDLNGDTKEAMHDITVLCVFAGEDHQSN